MLLKSIVLGKGSPFGEEFKSVAADVIGLAKEFSRTNNSEIRNALVSHFFPVVKYHANRLIKALPPRIDIEDLIQEGLVAVDDYFCNKFDASSPLPADEHYKMVFAYLGKGKNKGKIYYAIIDYLRREATDDGYVRQSESDGEVVAYHNGLVSLDEPLAQQDGGDIAILDFEGMRSITQMSSFPNPMDAVAQYETLEKILRAVDGLIPEQRVVVEGRINGHDWHEINAGLAAAGCGKLSESYISQNAARARKNLLKALGAEVACELV